MRSPFYPLTVELVGGDRFEVDGSSLSVVAPDGTVRYLNIQTNDWGASSVNLNVRLHGDSALQDVEVDYVAPTALPFGPDTVSWEVTPLGFLGSSRALLLQTSHPRVAAGVAQHSDYERDPWSRLLRTLTTMTHLAMGAPEVSQQMSRVLRRSHAAINGTQEDGRPYHFQRSWIRHKLRSTPADLRIMHVEGDSMMPTLHHGDIVLVDQFLDRTKRSAEHTFFADDMAINVEGAASIGITAHLYRDPAALLQAIEVFAAAGAVGSRREKQLPPPADGSSRGSQ